MGASERLCGLPELTSGRWAVLLLSTCLLCMFLGERDMLAWPLGCLSLQGALGQTLLAGAADLGGRCFLSQLEGSTTMPPQLGGVP